MNRPYQLGLWDVLDIVRRRRTFILRVLAVGVGLGALLSWAVHPVYRASATITADKMPPVILLDQPSLAGQTVGTPLLGVASPDLYTLVALVRSATVHDHALARLASTQGEVRAAEALLRTLRVQPSGNTQLVRISIEGRDPASAADAVNAVTASLVDLDLNGRRQWAREMRQSIEQQLVLANPRLRAAEDSVVAFKAQYGDVPMSEAAVAGLTRLAQLEAQRVDVRMQLQEARARIEAARNRLSRQAQVTPTQWKPSPLINTLQAQLATQEIELSGLTRQFTVKHPSVVMVTAKIAETKQKLDSEMTRTLLIDQYGVDPVYQQLAQQLRQDEVGSAALDVRDRALTAAIEQYEGAVRRLPMQELIQTRLLRNVKEAEAIHQVLTGKLQQALVAESTIGTVIRIVDAAKPPASPVRHQLLGLLMGTILGAVLGLGGALAGEQIQDPVKSVEHAEQALGTRILGAIPQMNPVDGWGAREIPEPRWRSLWPKTLPGRWSPADSRAATALSRSAFAESFRYLRTNLLCLHKQPLRTLMVTSAGRGDGSDLVAANLAIAFAHAGLRVWLVDCHLRRPAFDRATAFLSCGGEEACTGVAEVLGKGASARPLVRQTAIENLRFLPAGTRPHNPAELLGSQTMRDLLQQARDDVDVIVLSAPPVLAVSDAGALASSVEGVLLVAQIGTTPREAAQRARRQLETVGARIVGTVVTGAPMADVGSYFNYYAQHYGEEPSGAWYFGPAPRQGGAGPRAGASAMRVLRRVLRRSH